jgi:hypothetical protein
MNYRKRGLRYFSGFRFTLAAQYAVVNREGHDIDVAFIFPIEVDKSQVLLSDLAFKVNGTPEKLDLGEEGNRLVWTGRIPRGETCHFSIQYHARGLESFVYKMDPSLPARGVRLRLNVEGGSNYDYPANVLSANSVRVTRDSATLEWGFSSLESGINLGVILPSEKAYDEVIATMARRAWAPLLVFLAGILVLTLRHRRALALYDTYLLAGAYGFSFVVIAYLSAFVPFYVAYALTLLGLGGAVVLYLKKLFPQESWRLLGSLWLASMIVPSAAVVLDGYTGLIYTLELLTALLGAMVLSTRPRVRAFLSDLSLGQRPQEANQSW